MEKEAQHRPGGTSRNGRRDSLHTSRFASTMSVIAVGAMVTAGCNGDSPEVTASPTPTIVESPEPTVTATPELSPSPTVTATPLPDDVPDGEAPFPGDTASDTVDASDGARLSPVEMRFGVHEGFDRIVLDLEGDGLPGWLAQYDDDPRMAGSGHEVDIAGDAFLTVHVRGVIYPTEEDGVDFTGSDRLAADGGRVVQEVVYGNIFEGQADVYIGLNSEQPFRVFRLEDPTRVVIDVQHP